MTTEEKEVKKDNKARISKYWVVPVVLGSVGFGIFLGSAISVSARNTSSLTDATRQSTLKQLDLFANVLAKVTTDYVVEPEQDKLIAASINGMLQSLDPHSSFMTPADFKNMQQSTRGEYGGLGLEVTSDAGSVKIIAPMDDSPGQRAGILAGDRIIAIDGKNIVGEPLDDSIEKMRGKPNTNVELTIVRGEETKIIKVTREIIKLRPVKLKIEQDIAYIRISTFVNEHTSEELQKALDEVQAKLGTNVKGIILDLRNNGGGLLDQAIEVTDLFMDRGEVVSTRGRDPQDIERYYGTSGQRFAGVPMVVLVNEGSASASEIVAGALQDKKRAIIMGMTSFGKGSVQTIIPVGNGKDGALRLTTQRYYTPSGRSIQGSGIVPDYEVSGFYLTKEDIDRRKAEFRFEEDLPNALNNDSGAKRETPHMPKDMAPKDWKKEDDYVLKRAIQFILAGMPKDAVLPPLQMANTPKAAVKKDAKPGGVPVTFPKNQDKKN